MKDLYVGSGAGRTEASLKIGRIWFPTIVLIPVDLAIGSVP